MSSQIGHVLATLRFHGELDVSMSFQASISLLGAASRRCRLHDARNNLRTASQTAEQNFLENFPFFHDGIDCLDIHRRSV